MITQTQAEGLPLPAAPRKPEVTSRRSRVWAVLYLLIALAAGGAAAWLILHNLPQASTVPPAPQVKMTQVAIAVADLSIGTQLKADLLGTMEWPEEKLPPGAITDVKALEGRVTAVNLTKGELIVADRLAPQGAAPGIAAAVPTEMRVMAVKVDDVSGLYGWLHPGDRVDVITTMEEPLNPAGTERRLRAKIVLQNIQVKAVGEEQSSRDAKPVKVPVVMLVVTPEQSERLALAAKGQIQLTLRPVQDAREVDTTGVSPTDLFLEGEQPVKVASRHRSSRPKASPVVASTAPKPEPEVVEILRGDRLEQKNVRPREER